MNEIEIIITVGKKIEEVKPKTHNAYKLHSFDKKLLIRCIKSRQNELDKMYQYFKTIGEVEEINNECFDLMGLLAMIEESEQIKCVIDKKVVAQGWTFRGHSVDMPMAYSDNLDENTVIEVNL